MCRSAHFLLAVAGLILKVKASFVIAVFIVSETLRMIIEPES
jgi:hypothetical protein